MNEKKLIMNVDQKFAENIKVLEERLGIGRNAIIRLVINEKVKSYD